MAPKTNTTHAYTRKSLVNVITIIFSVLLFTYVDFIINSVAAVKRLYEPNKNN